jgi:hypothetical protein
MAGNLNLVLVRVGSQTLDDTLNEPSIWPGEYTPPARAR